MKNNCVEDCLRCLRDVLGHLPIDVDSGARAELRSVIARLESAVGDDETKDVAEVLDDAMSVVNRIVTLLLKAMDIIQGIWN